MVVAAMKLKDAYSLESESENEVAQSCPTFATPWTVAHQAPLSMGFSRQEYWSGLPFPSPGDRPNPEVKSMSLTSPALAAGFFTTSITWKENIIWTPYQL